MNARINFLGRLPTNCVVAFSGGVDSVAVADFLLAGKKKIMLAFFHHGTDSSSFGEEVARTFAKDRQIDIVVGHISGIRGKDASLEEFWRDKRYEFLSSFDKTVVTAHHLDDAVETWIFSALHGRAKLIPYRRNNVIRPFLVTEKRVLRNWCSRRSLTWVEDASNDDDRYMRNLIRHRIMPEALKVNPGLRKTLRKKYTSKEFCLV